jgi:serine phosphatase RsbU (regulator of sigma subunit)
VHFDPFTVGFLAAAGFFVIAGVYVALMRGAPLLRATFLLICAAVLPWVLGFVFMSGRSHEDAEPIYRVGLALTPLAGLGVMLFDLALARRFARHAVLVVVASVTTLASVVLALTTDLYLEEMFTTPSGVMFGVAGPAAPVHTGFIGAWVTIGGVILWRSLASEPSPVRRRQYKSALWAFSICALGCFDLLLAYRIGWVPLSWFFLTVGSLIALRSLLLDDLIHGAAIDRRVLWGVVYLAATTAGSWLLLRVAAGTALRAVLGGVALFLALRAAFALVRYLTRSDRPDESPATRTLGRYVEQVQRARSVEDVGAATGEAVQLLLGCQRLTFLVPSTEDYSWRYADGTRLPEEHTPDPLLLGWLCEHARPIQRDAVVAARLGDLRDALERLFVAHQAEIIVPLVSRDDVVGLLCLGALPGERALRPAELGLLARVEEHAAAGVVYAGMYRETNQRVEVAKEVELAAAVQEAFVPGPKLRHHGPMQVAGLYAPASRCGGDWWTAYPLTEDRLLVLIGDVTGHGVAAALVTAAAKGCYDVALRMMGGAVDLVQLLELLHATVRRTGGDQFHMTCFATLLDPRAGEVTFANAGHVVPYLCRRGPGGDARLDVLVARGNPLGTAQKPAYRSHTRPIATGDVLVWYTDGLVECTNPEQQQYGDRRFQRSLRRLVGNGADLVGIRDQLARDAAAFQNGHPPDDDITLVVAQLGPLE